MSNLTPTTTGTNYTSRIGVEVANGTGRKVGSDVELAMAKSNVRLKAVVEASNRFDALNRDTAGASA